MEKKSIRFSDAEFHAESFLKKKNHKKITKSVRFLQPLKIVVVKISNHIISFLIFPDFRTPENFKIGLSRAEKLAPKGGKGSLFLQRKKFHS